MSGAKIISVVGARPQFIKAAIVSKALLEAGITESVIHTGQHYDEAMSDGLIRELGISNIVQNFGVGSGSHATQTAAIMTKFDDFLNLHPEIRCVMVYGDTNSTLAAGVVAAKRGIPIVHVEAGLRSYNREMPEEINRVMVDHLSEILFCSSELGAANLATEGVTKGVHVVGDVMLDAFNYYSQKAEQQNAAADILRKIDGTPYAIVTVHRPSNTDDKNRFQSIVVALQQLGIKCLWPVHPRIKNRVTEISASPNLIACAPFSYLQVLHLLTRCEVVITDSGGLQKEAYWAHRKCVTLRDETEWTETLDCGWNTLFNTENEVNLAETVAREPVSPWRPLYGHGQSAQMIASILGKQIDAST